MAGEQTPGVLVHLARLSASDKLTEVEGFHKACIRFLLLRMQDQLCPTKWNSLSTNKTINEDGQSGGQGWPRRRGGRQKVK